MAVTTNRLSVAKYLINHLRAITEVRNNFLRTPLHNSSQLGLYAAVELLIYHGADTEALDAAGNKPRDLASNSSIIDLLRDKWKMANQPMNNIQLNCSTDIHRAILSKNITLLHELVIEQRKYKYEENCLTPIQLAATSCQLEMMKYLSELGEEMDVKFQGGVTLSHLAVLPSKNELDLKEIHIDKLRQPPNWEECPQVIMTPLRSYQERNYPQLTLMDENCGMDLLAILKELKVSTQ